MPRPVIALAVATIALAAALTGGWTGASGARTPSGAGAVAADQIILRVKVRGGAWKTYLPIRLVKTKLSQFTACAVWNQPDSRPFDCKAVTGERLPIRSLLRLEQNPIRRAVPRADSPGWGMVGLSDHPFIEAILSNTVSGDRAGKVYYRVTLRDGAGRVLVTSNRVTIFWHIK